MEQASLRLMAGLQGRGHTCRVLSLNPLGGLVPLLEKNGIAAEGIAYRGKGGWRSAAELKNRLASAEADALIMTGHNLLAMLLLGRLCEGRRVLAMHSYHTGLKTPWQWRIIYAVARRKFRYITYASDFIRREAEGIDPNIASIGVTVRNPLLLPEPPGEEARRSARARLGLPRHAKLVGNAGWLIEKKRFDVFLQVASRVSAADTAVAFVVAGDGDRRDGLMRLARDLGLQGRVFWLGWRKDMVSFYHAIDVLLFNSDWDAFPTTPLEAMSYGIPVVASVLHGGLGEAMSGAPLGRLFDRHDVDAMCEAVLDYANGVAPEAREEARRHIASICSHERCAAQVEELLANGR